VKDAEKLETLPGEGGRGEMVRFHRDGEFL